MTHPPERVGDVLRFGDFEVVPRSGDLRGPRGRVTLPDQPLQILLSLLERPGELVSREELRRRLWPDDTFGDFEHGLNAAVKRLRDALGDSADVPRYVETIPRRGYRLIAPVPQTRPAPESASSDSSDTKPAASSRSGRWRLVAGVAVVAGLVAAVVLWRSTRGHPPTGDVRTGAPTELTRLTFGEGLQTDVAWSPDGTRIAFASDRGGEMDIWTQTLDGSEPIPVASSPWPDSQPAWSPGGNQIVFRSERDDGGLFLVEATGGPARRLTTFGFEPGWHPDGEIYFTSHDLPGTFAKQLYSVVPDGASAPRERLSEFLSAGRWTSLRPRNDGRIMAVGQHDTMGFGVFALDLDGKVVESSRPPAALTAGLGLDGGRAMIEGRWNADGSALYLEVTPRGVSMVWRVPATRYVLRWEGAERLTSGPANATAMAISPDGRHVAFTDESRQVRAWVFPFDAIAGTLKGSGRPVTPEDTRVGDLKLFPDGRTILFTAVREGRQGSDVMLTDAETGNTRVIARNAGGIAASPDGQAITYRLRRPRPGGESTGAASAVEFAAAVRDSSGSERLLSDWSSQRLVATGDWLPNGSAALASYWSPFPDGPVALVLWPLRPGAHTHPDRVLLSDSTRAFWQAGFSPDGRFVSFVASSAGAAGLELGITPADTGAGKWWRVAADHRWPDKPRWAPDGRTLYFISRRPSGYYNLWGIRLDPMTARPTSEPFQISAFDTPSMAIEPNLAVSGISISAGRLAVTMRRATGSVWMLSEGNR